MSAPRGQCLARSWGPLTVALVLGSGCPARHTEVLVPWYRSQRDVKQQAEEEENTVCQCMPLQFSFDFGSIHKILSACTKCGNCNEDISNNCGREGGGGLTMKYCRAGQRQIGPPEFSHALNLERTGMPLSFAATAHCRGNLYW